MAQQIQLVLSSFLLARTIWSDCYGVVTCLLLKQALELFWLFVSWNMRFKIIQLFHSITFII